MPCDRSATHNHTRRAFLNTKHKTETDFDHIIDRQLEEKNRVSKQSLSLQPLIQPSNFQSSIYEPSSFYLFNLSFNRRIFHPNFFLPFHNVLPLQPLFQPSKFLSYL
uniref:Uncharacterized protein n=1 Tax=Cacopsylla melanoneura TaxID=428564 RepID=A0A8D8RHP9_9HEMI